MMSIEYWEILAELFLYPNKVDDAESIFCLCTRSLAYTGRPQIAKVPVDPHQLLERLTIDTDDEMEGAAIEHIGDAGAQCTSLTPAAEATSATWESYWGEHGEKIIWKSWIGKYGEYINPTHKPTVECAEIIISPSPQKDKIDIEEDDKFPVDNKDTLAIPRCDSTSSSKPPTIGTTDSMTNVTQLTMSQIDDFCKSPTTSVSVTPLSGSPNENDIEDFGEFEILNDDDMNRRWQELWEEHFHEQYTKTYADYTSTSPVPPKSQRSNDADYTFVNDDFDKLNDLGLPVEFGTKNTSRRNQPLQQPPTEQYLSTDRIRAAFALMGYPFVDATKANGDMSGKVIFRTGDIQKKNARLKIKRIRTATEAEGNAAGASNGTHSNANETPSENDAYEIVDDVLPDEVDDYDVVDTADAANARNPKRKRRKKKKMPQIPEDIFNDKPILKFWNKRFSLFSLFDMGIKLDRESWFSVTPEKIAKHTADRCKCDIIIDAFCGAGGNTIQFAKLCRRVIAIDLDPSKVEMARHNATIYGVNEKIEFIVGDYLKLAEKLQADAVFLSPPWGGLEYLKGGHYDVEKSLLPVGATQLLTVTRTISPNICVYLPRNTNTQQLAMLAGPGNSVEIQQNFLNNKLIAITAFYGNLQFNKPKENE